MPDDEIIQTYSFRVTVIAREQTTDYLQGNVQPGDALTLEPDASGVAVYHSSKHIGYVSSPEISRVLYPGIKYASWANNIEFDGQHLPLALNIEVGIYGNKQRSAQTHVNSPTQGSGSRGIAEPSLLYHASPTMFRAHPFSFVVALLLTPAIVGIVILVVWAVIARTTYLEIDNDTVRYETGVFSKDRRALSRRAIRTVRVTQTLFNRMLDVGSIEIFTAGDVPEIRAVSMFQPNDIREMLGK
jgi:membrane protein YdbS with pleckstrin-like domain